VTARAPARRIRPASPAAWAAVLGALAALSTVALVPLSIQTGQAFNGVVALVIGIPAAAVGLVVARRQPRNPLGWLLLAIGLCLILATDGSDSAFAARLQGAVDLATVRDDLTGVVHAALEPAHVSVWIAGRGG
jgi:hypothetical protein